MTVEIHFTRRDPRLIFENILDGKEKFDLFKVVAKREIEMIWEMQGGGKEGVGEEREIQRRYRNLKEM